MPLPVASATCSMRHEWHALRVRCHMRPELARVKAELMGSCSRKLMRSCSRPRVTRIRLHTCAHSLPGALTAAQVSEALGLAGIKNREWAIFQTSATKGEVGSRPSLLLSRPVFPARWHLLSFL